MSLLQIRSPAPTRTGVFFVSVSLVSGQPLGSDIGFSTIAGEISRSSALTVCSVKSLTLQMSNSVFTGHSAIITLNCKDQFHNVAQCDSSQVELRIIRASNQGLAQFINIQDLDHFTVNFTKSVDLSGTSMLFESGMTESGMIIFEVKVCRFFFSCDQVKNEQAANSPSFIRVLPKCPIGYVASSSLTCNLCPKSFYYRGGSSPSCVVRAANID